ncbi:acyltransferase family protein [Clostridium botulinum]|uniref:acyltransferase family protein n=1 Tax=Clostridium botulinum TaxID=1491 RepID=UPI0019682E6F|nr:acyltransferase family protein [Clostridium botulinum]MBN1066019.1 hypothetical protein [Clostridium botulinum]
MTLILLLFLCICIYNVKFSGVDNYFEDYLSLEKTTSIKGIFILLVFFSHFGSYVEFNSILDLHYVKLRSLWGQTIVTMFLFYSGYGVLESIKKKRNYINTIPVNRILKVLINFDIAIIIFLIVQTLLGKEYGIKRIFFSLIGWDGIGNSNWFIFSILITYIFTYIAFSVYKNNNLKSIIAISLLTIIFIGFMKIYKEEYWYNTIFCYVMGMWYSYFREKIEKLLLESNFTYIFSLIISILVFIMSHKYLKNFFMYEVWILSFVMIVVLITMKISFNNSILKWLGNNLFGLYILQRIPMIVFKFYNIHKTSIYLYFILSFITTIIIAYIFNNLTNKIKLSGYKKN